MSEVTSGMVAAWCSDPRIQRVVQMRVLPLFPPSFDPVVWPGCAGTDTMRVLKDVKLLTSAHAPNDVRMIVLVIWHHDCAGGGTQQGFVGTLEAAATAIAGYQQWEKPPALPPLLIGLEVYKDHGPMSVDGWNFRLATELESFIEALVITQAHWRRQPPEGAQIVGTCQSFDIARHSDVVAVLKELKASGRLREEAGKWYSTYGGGR